MYYRLVALWTVLALSNSCSGRLSSPEGGEGAAVGGTSDGVGGVDGEELAEPDLLPIGSSGLPLFVGNDSASTASTEFTDDSGREGVVAVSTDTESLRATIGTHTHGLNFGELYGRIEFSARASRPLSIFVSLSPIDVGYWAAAEEGRAWQGTEVFATEEWQEFSVVVEDMTPLNDGEPSPLGSDEGSSFNIFFEETEETTLWIADLALVE